MSRYIPEITNDGVDYYNYFGWGADVTATIIRIYEYVLKYDAPHTEEEYELTFTLSKMESEELLDIIQFNLTKFILFDYSAKCILNNVYDLNISYNSFKFEYHILYDDVFVDITHKNEKTTNVSIHKLKWLCDVLLKIKGS